jgi:methylenetetrahydrofolate--tRNA-(uracil-5-)-methyltransferase
MQAAEQSKIPAGGALAVDREKFAQIVTQKIKEHKNINVICEEVTQIPDGWCIIATGPLTTDKLSQGIRARLGEDLHFYDASAPIVAKESINFDKAFFGDRYGKGGDDYINCPLNKEEYDLFWEELVKAERVIAHDFEKREIFEGCMPLEVMAARGKDTLRFGPLKPVGLTDSDGNKFYAVLQLRKENEEGQAYNLVGCQTNLKFGEQKRVFSLIPALKDAEYLRYGVMHRNTYLQSPEYLNVDFSLKDDGKIFFAGQMTGVEGYVESAASGLLSAIHLKRKLEEREVIIPQNTTVCGALSAHISQKTPDFQPMNANFGILRAPDKKIRDKKLRYEYLATRALDEITKYNKEINS